MARFQLRYKWPFLDDFLEQDFSQVKALVRRMTFPLGVLFRGPYGCGKTAAALALARYLLCWDRIVELLRPCGQCYACRCFDDGQFENNNEFQLVNCAEASMEDYRRAYQQTVVAIRGACTVRLFEEAQRSQAVYRDCSLVELERSWKRALVYTASEERQQIFEGPFYQRVVVVEMRPLSVRGMVSLLNIVCAREGLTVDSDDVLVRIAEAAQGIPRVALNMLEQCALTDSNISQAALHGTLKLAIHQPGRNPSELLV